MQRSIPLLLLIAACAEGAGSQTGIVPTLDASDAASDSALQLPDAAIDAESTHPDASVEDATLDATPDADAPACSAACDAPPTAYCADVRTLREFEPSGVCEDALCRYRSHDRVCDLVCEDGACAEDPCAHVVCTPPPRTCASDRAVRIVEGGRCEEGECSFDVREETCSEFDHCEDGVCKAVPTTCDTSEGRVDVLDRDASVGRLHLIARGDGLDLFYIGVDGSGSFPWWHATLDPSGLLRGAPRMIGSGSMRHIAAAGNRFGITERTNDDAILHVYDPATGTKTTERIPRTGSTPGYIGEAQAVAFDPEHHEFGVLYDEAFDIDPSRPGSTFDRLFFARFTEDGVLVPGSHVALTGPDSSRTVTLSDWSNPLIWAGDHYVGAWGEYVGADATVVLGHIARDGSVRRIEIPADGANRAVVAWNGSDAYGVAWQDWSGDHYAAKATVVRSDVPAPAFYLGDSGQYSGEPAVAYGGGRFVVAFQQGAGTPRTGTDAMASTIDPVSLDHSTRSLTEPAFTDHEWAGNVVFTGCRFALATQRYLTEASAHVHFFVP